MVYRTLYYLVNILIRVFYRKLYINGLENIDPNKTYLITSNHPNGFFEPLIMACTFPIDLHFMVRGDMFENPFMNWFLRSTHQIPIFRFVDGYAKMKENKSSLEEATRTLKNGNSIMLFAEGSTKALMRCRPIQKGTAKMAFQAFDDYPNLELEILPVGINFNNWRDPGNEVIVNIGTPFDARPFYDVEQEERPKGIRNMTKKIEKRMKEEIIHLEEIEHEDWIRKMWSLLNLKESPWPRKTSKKANYNSLKVLAEQLNAGNFELTEEIGKLYDTCLNVNGQRHPLGIKKIWRNLFLIPGIIGFFFHLIPVSFGYFMRNNKVKRDAFAAPVLGITSFLVSIVLYIICFIVLTITATWWIGILFVLSVMVCGFCFVLFWENLHKVNRNRLPASFFNDLDALLKKLH